MIKLLFLPADPLAAAPAQLDAQLRAELRAVEAELRPPDVRNSFSLHALGATHAADWQQLLARHRPQIVHFSGRGSGAGALMASSGAGQPAPLDGAALSEVFRPLRDSVRCVVLDACYAEPQARAIAEQVDIVIGLAGAGGGAGSSQFLGAFYRALAENKDVQTAFDLGRAAIQNAAQGAGGPVLPQLLARPGVAPAQVSIGAGLLYAGDHYAWALLAVVALAVALHFATQLALRWLPVDANFFMASAQTISIAFVIISVLGGLGSEWGRTAVRTLWEKITSRFPELQYTRLLFLASVLLAVLFTTGFYMGTPPLAAQAEEAGRTALEAGQRNAALDAFRRAVRLEPDNACHYFYLGLAYELGRGPENEEKAIAAYERARELDEHLLPVYNNLGRLYLQQAETRGAARDLLLTGAEQLDNMASQTGSCAVAADQQLHRGVFLKNLAHAYLLDNMPAAAAKTLDAAGQALAAYDQIAPGATVIYWAELHGLRARLLAAAGQCEQSQDAWRDSEGYARSIPGSVACQEYGGLGNPQCVDAEQWIAEAEEAQAQPCAAP